MRLNRRQALIGTAGLVAGLGFDPVRGQDLGHDLDQLGIVTNAQPMQLPEDIARAPGITHTNGVGVGPYVALTFDDGPHPSLTPKLLRILEKRGAKANSPVPTPATPPGKEGHPLPPRFSESVRRVARACRRPHGAEMLVCRSLDRFPLFSTQRDSDSAHATRVCFLVPRPNRSVSGRKRPSFRERQKSMALLVPEVEARAAEALPKCYALGLRQDIVIPDNLVQTVEGNAAGQMMHMVNADVCADPAQDTGQRIV